LGSKLLWFFSCCLASVALSIGAISFLAGPGAAALPYNPLGELRRLAAQQPFSVAVKSGRVNQAAAAMGTVSPQEQGALDAFGAALREQGPTVRRINALIAFNSLLAQKAKSDGVYPNSGGKLVPAASALSLLDSAEFEKNVPRETLDKMRYISDGKSYKLVAIGTGDCAIVRVLRPAMIDPERSAGSLDCIAYGFWTPKGESY
jgi:hypothetical protein